MYTSFQSAVAGMLLLLSLPAAAMEFEWTKPAGQFRTEATPLVADFDGDGVAEILAVNMGGQVMLWAVDGAPIGSGQDGTVAQLPDGRWTAMPVLVEATDGRLLVFGSVEGDLVALNTAWDVAWQHALGAETTWSKAVPAVVPTDSGTLLCIGDASGHITALDEDGGVAWSTALDSGPCRAILQTYTDATGKTLLLAPVGESLFAIDTTGNVVWRQSLGGDVLSRPEVLPRPDGALILCGTRVGALYALKENGAIAWKTDLGGEIDTSITILPRDGEEPMVLCTGVWGNLYALDVNGNRLWKHIFDTKNRARPLLVDANGDGALDVLVATYDQRLLVFNAEGQLIDDVRLSGAINAAPVLVSNATGTSDVLVFSGALLASRLRPGLPVSPYGATGEPEGVWGFIDNVGVSSIFRLMNSHGALLRVNISVTHEGGRPEIFGLLTVRSMAELSLPALDPASASTVRIWVERPDGTLLDEVASGPLPEKPLPDLSGGLIVMPGEAYGAFEAAKASSDSGEVEMDPEYTSLLHKVAAFMDMQCGEGLLAIDTLMFGSLYQDEAGHEALIAANSGDNPARARVTVEWPTRADGSRFGGTLSLRELVSVGTVNGEQVPDALVELGPSGIIQVLAKRVAKVWVSADAHGAEPGAYIGKVSVQPLDGSDPSYLTIFLDVSVLRMPAHYPLTLCTWDYIPNQWFPDHASEVLDGMGAHGVNVFPRSTVPPATADPQGTLTMDWPVLDAELARLDGRGQILFHVGHPTITWPEGFPEAGKRAVELDYFHQFRGHLRDHGRDYGDYAFYPVDEPGLDYGTRVAGFVDAAELFREADPQFRIYTDPVPGLSVKDFERIAPLVDVWCPNMHLVTGLAAGDPRMAQIMASGKPVWSYECVSQVKSLSPLAYNRANAWRAWHFGLDGIGFWTFSTTEADHWLPGKSINDEYALVYPGDRPVSSVRWEAVRDGLEDVAALALLKVRIDANRDNPEKKALVAEAEEALRIATTDIMELSDPAYVQSRDYRAQGDRRIWHTATDERMFEIHRFTISRLTMELGE